MGNPRAAGKTVDDLIDDYGSQYAGKDGDRKRHLTYWRQRIGNVKITEVTPDLMLDERDLLLDEPGKRCGKQRQRAGSTVNRYMSAISAVFKFAEDKRILPPKSNPCVGLPRGKEVSRFGRALSDTEREALLEASRQSEWDRLYLAVLMGLTGPRKGELLSLRWDDLDFSKNTALLADTKNGEPRVLSLLDPIVAELKRLPRPLDSTVRLFPRSNDPHLPITDHEFYRYWNAAKEAAGITNLRFHELRHSAITLLIEAGTDLVTVASIVGHKTLAMVRRYSHLNHKPQHDALEKALRGKLG